MKIDLQILPRQNCDKSNESLEANLVQWINQQKKEIYKKTERYKNDV